MKTIALTVCVVVVMALVASSARAEGNDASYLDPMPVAMQGTEAGTRMLRAQGRMLTWCVANQDDIRGKMTSLIEGAKRTMALIAELDSHKWENDAGKAEGLRLRNQLVAQLPLYERAVDQDAGWLRDCDRLAATIKVQDERWQGMQAARMQAIDQARAERHAAEAEAPRRETSRESPGVSVLRVVSAGLSGFAGGYRPQPRETHCTTMGLPPGEMICR